MKLGILDKIHAVLRGYLLISTLAELNNITTYFVINFYQDNDLDLSFRMGVEPDGKIICADYVYMLKDGTIDPFSKRKDILRPDNPYLKDGGLLELPE